MDRTIRAVILELDGEPELLEGIRARGLKMAIGSASKNARTVLRRLGTDEILSDQGA